MPSSDSFIIRPANPEDRAAVLALVPRLRAFGPPALRSDEALDAGEERTLNRLFDAPPVGARLWVVDEEGAALLGMAYAECPVDYFTQETHGHLSINLFKTRTLTESTETERILAAQVRTRFRPSLFAR